MSELSPAQLSLGKRAAQILQDTGMLAALVVLFVACCITVPNFGTLKNFEGILIAVSTVGIISTTMLFCLASGNFDLSVGTLAPCAGVITALVMQKTAKLPWYESFALGTGSAIAFGALVGFINGFVVAVCRINPLITTLATMQMVKGFGLVISDSQSISDYQPAVIKLGSAAFPAFYTPDHMPIFRLTVPVWICFACFALFGFILNWTTFGRDTLAIGGNEEAARLAGVPVIRTKILIFTIQGIVTAIAGILILARTGAIQQDTSQGLELLVIAACVLGGVSLTGGIGKMSYVIAGVFIMGIVDNAQSLKDIQPPYRYVVSGAILLAAVLFDRFKQKRSA
ncbi:MAG TPA: L-arabinose ABC transporter permease AraH [Phycisphaerae bacterium]|nr:L-arabinose ABC transporter permease AraH [Phycisphaerae bacterium]